MIYDYTGTRQISIMYLKDEDKWYWGWIAKYDENGKIIDTDIQQNWGCIDFSCLETEYIFIAGIDQIGNDISKIEPTDAGFLMQYATNNLDCVAFNTFGYFKSKIEELVKPACFSEKDGIFIKKSYYDNVVKRLLNK